MYKFNLKCATCKKPLTIIEIYFDGMGNLLFDTVCVVCNKNAEYVTDMFRVIAYARHEDGITIFECNDTVN